MPYAVLAIICTVTIGLPSWRLVYYYKPPSYIIIIIIIDLEPLKDIFLDSEASGGEEGQRREGQPHYLTGLFLTFTDFVLYHDILTLYPAPSSQNRIRIHCSVLLAFCFSIRCLCILLIHDFMGGVPRVLSRIVYRAEVSLYF